MKRQKRLLAILLVIFGLSLIHAFWQSPSRPATAGASTGKSPERRLSRPRAAKGRSAAVKGRRLRLDLLVRKKAPFPGSRRDLFGPLFVEKPAPPPRPVIKTPPPKPIVKVQAPPPSPLPPPVAQRPPANFLYLGFLQKEGEKTFFLSLDKTIFVVKKGEHFGRGKEFSVAGLSANQLTIRRRNDPTPIQLPLTKNPPAIPTALNAPPKSFRRFFPGAPGSLPWPPNLPRPGQMKNANAITGVTPPVVEPPGPNGATPAGRDIQ